MHTCKLCRSTFDTEHGRQVFCYTCISFSETGNVLIYGLRKRGSDIRYIGHTVNPVQRFHSHLNSSSDFNKSLREWIDAGDSMEMVWLEVVPKTAARQAEERQIRKHRAQGCKLFNARQASRKPFTKAEIHAVLSGLSD